MNFLEAYKQFQNHMSSANMHAAWSALRCAILEPYNAADLHKLNQTILKHESLWIDFTQGQQLRVALLGGYTTQPIRELILPLFLSEGFWTEIYEGNYNSFATEPLDLNSFLYRFNPDIVLIATGSVNLTELPTLGTDESCLEELIHKQLAVHSKRWDAILANSKARIIQHNYDLPQVQPLGRLENRYPWSTTSYIKRLNNHLWKHDGNKIYLLDMEYISSICGRWQWFDPRWYHHSKHGFNPKLIYQYGCLLGGLLRAMLGKTRKCLVTDLDNTLWGGVIGDDGIEGIELGNTSATGEAFSAFGSYLKALRQLGVILAVNSKNDPKNAKEVFCNHPESILKLDDFAAFICNWNSKSENLKLIANQLNMGLDSFVFIDDNPVECDEVRTILPEVTVIEMSGDPASFQRRIEELHLFTPLEITAEDFTRMNSYSVQKQITEASTSSEELEMYLRGLQMEAIIRPAQSVDLSRIEQLFRKTNQFNLTSKVYDQQQLIYFTESKQHILLAAWLKDRVTNHGLVSIIAVIVDNDIFVIDNWVMSCRVFSRTFEYCIFLYLLQLAKERNCSVIRGEFVPTKKNSYVEPLYEKLGFCRITSNSHLVFELSVDKAISPSSYVKLMEKSLSACSSKTNEIRV